MLAAPRVPRVTGHIRPKGVHKDVSEHTLLPLLEAHLVVVRETDLPLMNQDQGKIGTQEEVIAVGTAGGGEEGGVADELDLRVISLFAIVGGRPFVRVTILPYDLLIIRRCVVATTRARHETSKGCTRARHETSEGLFRLDLHLMWQSVTKDQILLNMDIVKVMTEHAIAKMVNYPLFFPGCFD